MAQLKEALDCVGELILTGIEGKTLSAEGQSFLQQAKPGGIILFSHNYESPEQIATLIEQVQSCSKELPFWISVDQEGGRVQRFKEPFTLIPSADSVAATGSPKLAFEVGQVIATELKAIGVNLNFAPVADINTNPANPVIGTRSYGSTEEAVSKILTGTLRGLLVNGVQACIKHFPGHGDTHVDSHFDLPTVNTPLDLLRSREFKPFGKAFRSKCNFVMTAHILLPHLDPKFPATLSKTIINDYLRGELKFAGVIVSDDMEMHAITKNFGAEEAPILAIEAGCDLLIYRSQNAAAIAYKSLLGAVQNGRITPQKILDSVKLLRELKKEFLLPYKKADIPTLRGQIGLPEAKALMDLVRTNSKN